MNKVILTGMITQPETKELSSGSKVTSFSLATNEDWYNKDKQEWVKDTEWHNVVLWKSTKLQKGDLIELEGKIKTESWEDKDGTKKYTTKIIASHCKLLNRNKKDDLPTQNEKVFNDSLLF